MTPIFGQVTTLPKAAVITSVHNVSGNGCQSCHAPHNGARALIAGGSQSTGVILLWNRTIPVLTYGTYDSVSMDNKTVEIGASLPQKDEARIYSLLCMSCHDGVTTTGIGIGPTEPVAVGNVDNSFGLQNDHPVNMPYDNTVDTGLNAPNTSGPGTVDIGGLPLFGTANTVQCATCHDPHNSTVDPQTGATKGGPFLRTSNVDAALCTTCNI